jgi:hypothetical protein
MKKKENKKEEGNPKYKCEICKKKFRSKSLQYFKGRFLCLDCRRRRQHIIPINIESLRQKRIRAYKKLNSRPRKVSSQGAISIPPYFAGRYVKVTILRRKDE